MTPVTLYNNSVVYWQGDSWPVIVEGCEGTEGKTATASVCGGPFPQELEGVTVTSPGVVPAVTTMLLLPCPAVTDHPEGTFQVQVTPEMLVTV